jgi:hypothetical protein
MLAIEAIRLGQRQKQDHGRLHPDPIRVSPLRQRMLDDMRMLSAFWLPNSAPCIVRTCEMSGSG